MRRTLFTLAVLTSALLPSIAAHADTIDDFVFTGTGSIITFSLPVSPTDIFVIPNNGGFATGTDVTINGVTTDVGLQFLPGGILGGGVAFNPPLDFTMNGPVLYSGTPADPTFLTGTFEMFSFTAPTFRYELTITPESPAPVPEPGTCLLLATGLLGLLLFTTRRHRITQL